MIPAPASGCSLVPSPATARARLASGRGPVSHGGIGSWSATAPLAVPPWSYGHGRQLDQAAALDLTGRARAGNGVDDHQTAGVLVGRQQAFTVPAQCCQVDRLSFAHDDEGGDDLAPRVVGDAGHGRVAQRRVALEHGVDLGRCDRLAAGADEVLVPSDDRVVALVVDLGQLARAVPAVDEGASGGLGIAEVAAEQMRALGPQLVVVEAHVHAGTGWT